METRILLQCTFKGAIRFDKDDPLQKITWALLDTSPKLHITIADKAYEFLWKGSTSGSKISPSLQVGGFVTVRTVEIVMATPDCTHEELMAVAQYFTDAISSASTAGNYSLLNIKVSFKMYGGEIEVTQEKSEVA